MIKKLKEILPQVIEKGVPNSVIPVFRQLVTYIDGGLAESYQKEGDERAAQLVAHMLNLRDFMSRQVTENSVRQACLVEMLEIINELETIENKSNDVLESKDKQPQVDKEVEVASEKNDSKKKEDDSIETSLSQE